MDDAASYFADMQRAKGSRKSRKGQQKMKINKKDLR